MGQNEDFSKIDITGDIPVIEVVVPETTEKINFTKSKISSVEMAQRAYHCACKYRILINSVINDCPSISPVMYSEHLASIIGVTCEIFIKSLLFYQQDSQICKLEIGHDIFDLYAKLNDEIKNQIYSAYCNSEKVIPLSEFQDALKRNRHNFTLYRYEYELKCTSIELHFIRVLMEILFNVSYEVLYHPQGEKNE